MESHILTFLDRKTQHCKDVSLVYEFHIIPIKIGMQFLKNNFIYFWPCGLFSSCSELQLLFVVLQGLLIAMAPPVAEHRLYSAQASVAAARDSVVAVSRLSCSVACGIFPDQCSNPCLLHWQVGSLPLNHQGNPGM